jgi:hypothetical protein
VGHHSSAPEFRQQFIHVEKPRAKIQILLLFLGDSFKGRKTLPQAHPEYQHLVACKVKIL